MLEGRKFQDPVSAGLGKQANLKTFRDGEKKIRKETAEELSEKLNELGDHNILTVSSENRKVLENTIRSVNDTIAWGWYD